MADQADVLIVEDEKRLRYFAGEVFRMEGISAASVADGCQALTYFEDMLKQGGIMPRVIILDMTMPCLNGVEVYKHIAAQAWSANTTVIITSAAGDTVEELPGPAQTLTLHKPYEVTALVETVRRAAPELFPEKAK